MRYAFAALFALAALLLVTAALIVSAPGGDDEFAMCRSTRIAGGAEALGGPFSLIDETQRRVSEADVFTKPSLVYFGYTYCPDVCPIDSARNADVVGQLTEAGHNLGHVFISVDPARDTPEVLTEYTSFFDDNMLGLTGTPQEVSRAAKAYRVYYAMNDDSEDYLVDHSAFTYLVGTNGKVIEIFRRSQEADELAQSLSCFLDRMS